MNKKIAIPVTNGMLDEHFGHCAQFKLYTVINNQVADETTIDAPPHQPGLLPPWLSQQGVTDVLAGGMGQRAIQLFNQNNVNVFVGAPMASANEIVQGFLSKSLSFSANYCDH